MAKSEKSNHPISVLENPRIKASNTTEIKTFTTTERDADLDRYWAEIDLPERRRRVFPVEFSQLDPLIKKTGQLAVIVKNINDPYKVTVKWASFSPEKPPVLETNSRCFVLTQQYYDGIVAILDLGTVSHSIGGLKRIKLERLLSNFIIVLLGKDSAGEYTLYLQNVSASPIVEDPRDNFDTSPGGEGAGGVKLPGM